ncbi:glycosyltransferase [Propionispora hippei]|uniref:Glycosyltransferase involved in cell wall bisynthesis n=1 Tax=Propionispora hippei DSM 15287 TaxID=1123003 RepID=A0A1M6NVB8_9FIRM|nr:glycosyltransferase [Propionispora hippei]SHJ99592.1 Glycosyltransferase involved in cell wall bisynthesis [Propionispora hippei DSM 15287]
MKILFIHRTFPGQFRYLATVLAQNSCNKVVFLTTSEIGDIPGVTKVLYKPHRNSYISTHPYLKNMEDSVIYGQAAYKTATQLKKDGFVPDVIYGHSGWGPMLFMADVFPRVPIICHFEWFYRSHGSSFDFDPESRLTLDNKGEIRVKNTGILFDLVQCTKGIVPTEWQFQQFPREFHPKMEILHEGIHTGIFKPNPNGRLILPKLGLNLSNAKEIVTYVATGMEPLRGFPQFMAAVEKVQQLRPECHVIVVGEDRTEYSNQLSNGKTYREEAMGKYTYDLSRLHFTGRVPISDYLTILQASSVHIYLTYPFILSWSMLEAMACGCLVVGSDTPPVREIIEDTVNGFLVSFFSPSEIASRVVEVLENREAINLMKTKARNTILTKYDLTNLLNRQIRLLETVISKGV